MPRIKKKGQAGQAKNFITRTQAVRKLQVSLPDFRRLCIFKGIYPREPRNKKKASKTSGPNTTFYYSKDIQYLLHEPLLAKFREHKAVSKKIARSLGKGEVGDAARLDKTHNKKIPLDHIIKERYPTFVDALRDLDDALSLLFLFANLPSTTTVPSKTIALCQRLCHEFQHYLIVSHAVRKSFISIKGIYYQATIQGQDILWLVPHKFVQRVTGDVDFRIMGTFVEFYTTLLGFINYRLYTTIGLVYPPKLDSKTDEQGGELDAFRLENLGLNGANGEAKTVVKGAIQDTEAEPDIDAAMQARVDELTRLSPEAETSRHEASFEKAPQAEEQFMVDTIDKFDTLGTGADDLPQPSTESQASGTIFSNMVFFLSRETPRQPLEFLLRAFGSKRIGWDSVLGAGAFTHDELEPSITHHVVDRPPVMAEHEQNTTAVDNESTKRPRTFQYGYRVPGRAYVQPQWVWDCINTGQILRADLYAPGALLPPHLSPFVKPKEGDYDPTKSLAEQEREGEVEEFEEAEKEAEALEQGSRQNPQVENEDDDYEVDEESSEENGMQIAASDDEEDEKEQNYRSEEGVVAGPSDLSSDPEEDLEDDNSTAAMHQAELEAEAQGLTTVEAQKKGLKGILKKSDGNEIRRKANKKRNAEQEEQERRMGMMPRKKKKLYEKMQYGLKRDSEQAEKLRTKRRKLEKSQNL